MDAGAGALAARTLADAARVVAAAAGATAAWAEAAGAAAQAQALCRRAGGLGQANAEAYAAARRALAGELPQGGQKERDRILADTLQRAAAPPLALALLGADVAGLGAHVAEHADGRAAADAAGAAAVAAGAAAAAAQLVAVNLAMRAGDERPALARAAADRALDSAAVALDNAR